MKPHQKNDQQPSETAKNQLYSEQIAKKWPKNRLFRIFRQLKNYLKMHHYHQSIEKPYSNLFQKTRSKYHQNLLRKINFRPENQIY